MLKFVYKVYARADITLREMEQSFSKQAFLENFCVNQSLMQIPQDSSNRTMKVPALLKLIFKRRVAG